MVSTTFTDASATSGGTTVVAAWLNDVNTAVYTLFGGLTVPASGKILQSNGTKFISSAFTLPITIGAAGTLLRSDATNFLTWGTTIPDTGTSGGILGYTATGILASSVLLTASALVLGGGAGATPTPMGSLGTTTTVLHGNAAGAPTFASVNLTAGGDVTGTLPVGNGGTGITVGIAGKVFGGVTPALTSNPVLGAVGTTGTLGLAGTTSGVVTIQPASVAGTWSLTLPTSAGANTNVLQTDGTGITSWVAPAAGASGALPTATVGHLAVNGVATTFLRSDGAPAIASAGVGQAQLKTTTGDISVNGASALVTGPGGEYGFWPTVKSSETSLRGYVCSPLSSVDNAGSAITFSLTLTFVQDFVLSAVIILTVRQRYVQASPPYDLGDGDIPLFIFALVDTLGNVLATYIAPEPPWANNGPTNIHPDFIDAQGRAWQTRKPKADMKALKNPALRDAELARIAIPQTIEVTQALKQADMPLIPHPFQGNDMIGRTVVLLDPVSALIGTLAELHATGEALGELLHDKHILLDNVPLARKSPPGVSAFTAKWK